MRPVHAAALLLTIVVSSCVRLPELLDTEPRTVTLEPSTMHVARHLNRYRTGICVGVDRTGGLSALYSGWVASLPVGTGRAEVITGRVSTKHSGESCDTWLHSIFQGLVFFNVSRLPDGVVTGATISFDRSPLFDPRLPSDDCLFEVGAAAEDVRTRSTTRVPMPQLSHGDKDNLIAARDPWLIGPRESSADVTRIVSRWDLGVYSDFGFAFTPFVRNYPEVEVACAIRLENIRLEVTLEVPVET